MGRTGSHAFTIPPIYPPLYTPIFTTTTNKNDHNNFEEVTDEASDFQIMPYYVQSVDNINNIEAVC